MPLAQDQFRQKSHKSYENEFHLKLDTSKDCFADPKDVWEINCNREEEKSISGNNSEVDAENNVIYKKPHFKCGEDRYFGEEKTASRKGCQQQKNVRFESSDCSFVDDTSAENDYSDPELEFQEKGPCPQHDKRRCCSMMNETGGKRFSRDGKAEKVSEDRCYRLRTTDCCGNRSLSKQRMIDCINCDPRTKQSNADNPRRLANDGFEHRARRLSPKGKVTHKGRCEAHREMCSSELHDHGKIRPTHGTNREEVHRCGDWCKRDPGEEPRDKTGISVHALRHAKPYKHVHHAKRDKTGEVSWKKEDSPVPAKAHAYPSMIHQMTKIDSDWYHHSKDSCQHIFSSKQKKKVLDSYEKLPVVDESQEQFSDASYKKSHTAFPNLDAGDSVTNFTQSGEEVKYPFDRGPSWILYDNKAPESTLSENPPYDVHRKRTVKTRSRRTRMNRSRRNRWTKTYIHTVLDKSQKQIVGLMVMGPMGPEFYSRLLSIKECCIPFRKSRSFPEGPTKSYMSLNFEPKEVLVSASDPGRKAIIPNNDPLSPEEDMRVDEKVADFDKNVNEIVKSTEQKFLQTLTRDIFRGPTTPPKSPKDISSQPARKEDSMKIEKLDEFKNVKYPPFYKLPMEELTAKVPKSMQKYEKSGRDIFAFNVESKTLTENLNDQAKQFRMGKLNQEDELSSRLSDLQRKFPSKPLDKETAEANLSLWGMKLNESNLREVRSEGGKGDGSDSHREFNVETPVKKSSDCGDHDRNRCAIHSKENAKSKNAVSGEASEAESEKLNEQTIDDTNKQKTVKNQRGKRPDEKEAGTKGISETGGEKVNELTPKSSKWMESPRKEGGETCEESQARDRQKEHIELDQMLPNMFKILVQNGCAMSEKQLEHLQKLFKNVKSEAELNAAQEACSTSSEAPPDVKEEPTPRYTKATSSYEDDSINKLHLKVPSVKRSPMCQRDGDRREGCNNEDEKKAAGKTSEDCRPADGYLSDSTSKKCSKSKQAAEDKIWMKILSKQRDSKSKRRHMTVEKKKLLREALPRMAAENKAAHLKQLKKCIHRFIDHVELKTSSSTEMRRSKSKTRDTTSSDGSEVRVDAQRLIDIVSNPFKRITSDMTIDMARKLTDALVQETSSKSKTPKTYPSSPKTRKNSDDGTEDDASGPFPSTSGSDRGDEVEPMYLKQLKKMRNDHLRNIKMEVRRMTELLRFLDRCERLKP